MLARSEPAGPRRPNGNAIPCAEMQEGAVQDRPFCFLGCAEAYCVGPSFRPTLSTSSDAVLRLAAMSTSGSGSALIGPVVGRLNRLHPQLRVRLLVAPWQELPERARAREVDAKRARGETTVPTRIDIELATNPFLRAREPAVIRAAEAHAGRRLGSPVEVFAILREWKNVF
mgnify:CR=1 FL=1